MAGKLTRAGRKAISEASKARWAKFHAAKENGTKPSKHDDTKQDALTLVLHFENWEALAHYLVKINKDPTLHADVSMMLTEGEAEQTRKAVNS